MVRVAKGIGEKNMETTRIDNCEKDLGSGLEEKLDGK